MGIACDVIEPSLIPVRAGDRVKADRRDAVKIARLYRAEELTTITVPSAEQEAVRDSCVPATRCARTHRSTPPLGKFLIRHGRVFHGGKNWTQRFWVWLRTQQLDRDCERLTFEHHVHEVEHHVERR
jgi:hypothetical protein